MIYRFPKSLGGLLICLLISQGCAQENSRRQEINLPRPLKKAYEVAEQSENIRSFLVSTNGELILEEYFDSQKPDRLNHVRSVTKSIMATLIGIAIDKGLIDSVDDPIGNYLEEDAKGKEAITISHLLSMTSGLQWDEGLNAEGYGSWVSSTNQLKNALGRSTTAKPGSSWNYNSGAIHILSAILTRTSGMSTQQFAEQHLFGPMEITDYRWQKLSDGYFNGAAGLELRPKDMIKIGEMYANEGLYKEQRIISQSYVAAATSHHQPAGMPLDEGAGYGYCWWLAKRKGINIYVAVGYGGQIIAILKELDTVVAITHHWRVNGNMAHQQERRSTNKILRAVVEEMLESR